MVTVTNYVQKETAKGKMFYALELTGDIEMSISKTTGRPFATVRKTTIASTFDEVICKTLIGKQLPGSILKVETDEPYEYTVPSTGETILLDYRYEYSANEDNSSVEAAVLG